MVGVRIGVHQGSVLIPLLFIIVLEALSREIRTGCPWELLYADDLMISAGSMSKVELLVLLKAREDGLASEHGKDKDYGLWLGFGTVEEIWKRSLRCLSERSR